MAGEILHQKTNTLPDWTQANIDQQIAAGLLPPGSTIDNITLASDWNESHIFQFGDVTTTQTVGGVPSGTDLNGLNVYDILVQMFSPSGFSSFTMSGQAQNVEVGTTLSGSKSFAFSFLNPGTVIANTFDILDVTGGTTLVTDAPTTSPQAANIGTIQLTSPGSYSWRGRADVTGPTTILSQLFTVNWRWKRFNGTSASTTLNEADIEGLASNALAAGFAGTYTFASGDYKYFAWPDSFGSPTASTGFKDASTNLALGMATSADNAAYSNTQNGWSYALVSVTNAFGLTTNYRVYRTKNVLGGSLTAVVS